MLTKLLHYEFKTTGRIVLPIAAGVLVLNVFTNVLTHLIQNTSRTLPLVGVGMALLNLASVVSLLVVLVVCFFIEVQQFYRLLGDRGYLMLALPVHTWQHIAAKVICGTAWTLFGMVFFTLCGTLTADSVSGGFESDFSRATAEDFAIWAALFLIVLALIVGALLHAYLACAFAAQFTQQRLLISIAAYFVIAFAGQMAALVTGFFIAMRGYEYFGNYDYSSATALFSPDNTLQVILGTLFAVFALLALVDALLWALTQWLMSKRLNLA